MPKTKKPPVRKAKAKSTTELTKELADVKAELHTLRQRFGRMNRTLLRLCCPKEWFEEEVDDDEVWSQAAGQPSLREIIDSLK